MNRTVTGLLRTVAAASTWALAAPVDAQPLFWSTQANPIEETQAMREQVLAGFAGGVDYQSSDGGPWLTRLQAEVQAGYGHHRRARGRCTATSPSLRRRPGRSLRHRRERRSTRR